MGTKKFSLKEFVISEKFYFWFIAAAMVTIPAGEFITELFNRPFISQHYIVAVYGCVGFFSTVCFFMKKAKSGKGKLYGSDVFFIMLMLFAMLSLIFSKDIMQSIGGIYHYNEWIFHHFAYYCLMFGGTMITDGKRRKVLLYVFAAVAFFHCIFAFPQSFGITLSYCYGNIPFHMKTKAIYGFTTNCNFFAALSTMFSALSAGLFIFSENGKKRWAFFALYILCFYCCMATTARIAWLGNIGTHCFYIISFVVMKVKNYDSGKLKKHFIGWSLIIAVSLIVLVYFALFTNILQSGLQETINDISGKYDFENFGSRRGYIWKFGLEALPDNWLLGVGIDNYAYVFYSNPKWSSDMYLAAKAHNEYLDVLVTQGVFAAVNYLSMLIYAVTVGVKTVIKTDNYEKRYMTWILLGMFAGYSAQALVNNSIVNIAPYFWIVVGMTMPKCDQKPLRLKRKV